MAGTVQVLSGQAGREQALDTETSRVRAIMDRGAPRYDRQMDFVEKVLFQGGRDWVCSQARGDTLEIAVGTGRNLAHYADDVKLAGLELSPAMLDLAQARAHRLELQADLRLGDAQFLPFADASFDTVVCTLALCTIPDDKKAVQEVRRVLRPGGLFLLLEHVRSPKRVVRGVQQVLDHVMVRLEGDHMLREPLEHLKSEGFEVLKLEWSKLGMVERVTARRPA